MPGSSLWLLPPPSHPLNTVLSTLIQQTSSCFDSQHLFIPHVTLTSEIAETTYSADPQAWLDSLPFPSASSVQVKFGKLQSENVFVRKLYISVDKAGVKEIGWTSRRQVEGFQTEDAAGKWVEDNYTPHLSLLYHDCPKLSEDDVKKIETIVKDAGVSLVGVGDFGGWSGGTVVLVPTDRPVREWQPLGSRAL